MVLQNSQNKNLVAGTKVNLGSDVLGDLWYRGTGGVMTRLPLGTNGQALRVAAGLPVWQALGTASTLDTGTAAGNIPILDASGLLSTSVIPPLAINSIQIVANQAARLALANVQPGDSAKQTDNGLTYMLAATPATTDANWIPIGDTTIDAADIVSGIVAPARLGTGTANATTFLRGDNTWTTITAKDPYVEVTATTQAVAANTRYGANNAGLVVLTLPTTAALGDTFQFVGKGAGLFRIAQNVGQQIRYGDLSTTSGTAGRIDSQQQYDSITLVCITANTEFAVTQSQGNLDVV